MTPNPFLCEETTVSVSRFLLEDPHLEISNVPRFINSIRPCIGKRSKRYAVANRLRTHLAFKVIDIVVGVEKRSRDPMNDVKMCIETLICLLMRRGFQPNVLWLVTTRQIYPMEVLGSDKEQLGCLEYLANIFSPTRVGKREAFDCGLMLSLSYQGTLVISDVSGALSVLNF